MALNQITSKSIATGTVTADDLHTTLDFSNKTFTMHNNHITETMVTQHSAPIIAQITDSAPATLDTLNELAAALGDDPNFATTTANNIATKLPLAGGTLTGDVAINAKLSIDQNDNSDPVLRMDGLNGAFNHGRYGHTLIQNKNNSTSNWWGLSPRDGGNMEISYGSPNAFGSLTSGAIMSFTTDGLVGIGTQTPEATLHIADVGSTGPGLHISGGSSTEGDITVPHNENLQIGHWNESTDTYTNRILMDTNGDVGIGTTSPDSTLHVSGNVKVGSAASSSWAASVHDAGGLDIITGSGSHLIQAWDDNYQSRPRFEVARDGHIWAGQNMQFHENNTSTTSPFNITNSSSTENWFVPVTYGSGSVNRTYRHCYNINADTHWVLFDGGGGNTVFTTYAFIGGEHYRDITVWTITQYYSDLKIKVVQDAGSSKSIWVAGDTYQDNVYSLRWRIQPTRPCDIYHNPGSSQSAWHMVHHASGGEEFSSTSSASSGQGPSTF